MTKKILPLAIAPLMALSCLLSAASSAHAVATTDNDILSSANGVNTSTAFSGFAAPGLIDGAAANPFVFADGDQNPRIAINGISAPQGIDTLRIFDTPQFSERVSTDVRIYYSAASILDIDPASYTLLGGFVLPTMDEVQHNNGNAVHDAYTNPTFSPLESAGTFPGGGDRVINYAELTGLGIPAGTQSVLLQLTPSDTVNFQGAGVQEVQLYAIPEPAGMISLLFGAVSLMVLRRRA